MGIGGEPPAKGHSPEEEQKLNRVLQPELQKIVEQFDKKLSDFFSTPEGREMQEDAANLVETIDSLLPKENTPPAKIRMRLVAVHENWHVLFMLWDQAYIQFRDEDEPYVKLLRPYQTDILMRSKQPLHPWILGTLGVSGALREHREHPPQVHADEGHLTTMYRQMYTVFEAALNRHLFEKVGGIDYRAFENEIFQPIEAWNKAHPDNEVDFFPTEEDKKKLLYPNGDYGPIRLRED